MIKKGSIYWVNFSGTSSSGGQGRRPCLVIQNDVLNESRLNTTIVVGITALPEFGKLPGNVIVKKGIANMPWQGVINVSQILSIEKNQVAEELGILPPDLFRKVSEGLRLVMQLD